MKKLTLTLLLLCGLYSFAQTGCIEVTVTDTVWMKPVSFDYNVIIKDNPYAALAMYGEGDGDDDAKQQQEDTKQKLKTLESFLGKKGYTLKKLQTNELNVFRAGIESQGFTVTVKTNQQLEKLKEEIEALDYVNGSMGDVNFGDKAIYDSRIYKKLIENARKKAQVIAGYSGQKLGKITEIKEPSSAANGMENYMKEISRVFESMGNLKRGDDNKLYGELTKTLVVKFVTE